MRIERATTACMLTIGPDGPESGVRLAYWLPASLASKNRRGDALAAARAPQFDVAGDAAVAGVGKHLR